MQVRVEGKVAIITGAAQGIGWAIAWRLAEAGAAGVLLVDRNATGSVEAEIVAAGSQAAGLQADLADAAVPERIITACLDRFGRLDILVNAAALTDRAAVCDADADLFDRLLAVNTRAPLLLMRHAVQQMTAQGTGGAVVNILSMNMHGGTPDLALYAASKAALATLTKNAAHAHRFDRIRINGINLGWADTPGERHMHAVTLGKGEDWLVQQAATQPFGRFIEPDDVARLALFLASDCSVPMTGALIDQAQWVVGARD
jgi:NAD(P)-dependent dehydrogenase (short-subunit alcohol dehydrogenase family)